MGDHRDERMVRSERRIGRVLGNKWRLDSLIGLGGMAAVYAATHTNNLRTAAIKMLHPEFAGSEELRRRFLREGYIANKVNHPGVVSILDDGIDDGSVFLVMELFHGETLQARFERNDRRLPVDQILHIVDQLLDVLSTAHDAGIVHRDLKPENIFITDTGDVKVLDFGIARFREQRTDFTTQAGALVGTPAYMPPEQVTGQMQLIDHRTDLWAVGAIMFTLLTGTYVHDAKTANALLLQAMSDPARKLCDVLPSATPQLGAVVDRALEYEREARWQSAREMQTAIRELLATPSVPDVVMSPRAEVRIVRNTTGPTARAGLAVVAIAGLLAGGVLAAAAWSYKRAHSDQTTDQALGSPSASAEVPITEASDIDGAASAGPEGPMTEATDVDGAASEGPSAPPPTEGALQTESNTDSAKPAGDDNPMATDSPVKDGSTDEGSGAHIEPRATSSSPPKAPAPVAPSRRPSAPATASPPRPRPPAPRHSPIVKAPSQPAPHDPPKRSRWW